MQDIYKHLRSYGFSKQHEIQYRLGKSSEAKLASLMESYLDVAQKHPLAISAPIGATDIYPDSRDLPLSYATIRQLAIYAGRIYIHDPLLEMVYKWQRLDVNMPLVAKYHSREERVAYFREQLGTTINKLLALQPLVEAGIVHLAPTELIQPKRESGAMYVDDFYGPDESLDDKLGQHKTLKNLPAQISEYCEQSLTVLPAKLVDGEPVILDSDPLRPRNMIAIQFVGEPVLKYYLSGLRTSLTVLSRESLKTSLTVFEYCSLS